MFHKNNVFEPDAYENGFVYKPSNLGSRDMREVEKSFARLFASDDGQRVLAHLSRITFERALGAAASDAHLRYIEGQRGLLSTMLQTIERGRKPA